MVEKFLERYKYKSQRELEFIVSSRSKYQPEAVEAAIKLLDEKFHTNLAKTNFLKKPQEDTRKIAKSSKKSSPDFYIHTFSNREITSAVACAFLFVALAKLFIYYRSEDWIDDSYGIILFTCFVITNIPNHILYKKEHRTRNLLWGRIVQVSLTTVMILILFSVQILIDQHQTFFLDVDNVFGMFIFLVILVFATEFIISILRRILLLFKWQIW